MLGHSLLLQHCETHREVFGLVGPCSVPRRGQGSEPEPRVTAAEQDKAITPAGGSLPTSPTSSHGAEHTHPSASNEGWGCSCSPRCGNPHQCVKPTASPALQAGICLLELSMCCVPGLLLPSTASVRIYGHRNHSEAYSDSDQ